MNLIHHWLEIMYAHFNELLVLWMENVWSRICSTDLLTWNYFFQSENHCDLVRMGKVFVFLFSQIYLFSVLDTNLVKIYLLGYITADKLLQFTTQMTGRLSRGDLVWWRETVHILLWTEQLLKYGWFFLVNQNHHSPELSPGGRAAVLHVSLHLLPLEQLLTQKTT